MNIKRPSAQQFRAQREHAIQRLKESQWWQRGEKFKSTDMAQLLNIKVQYCQDLLTEMWDRGEVSGARQTNGVTLYSRPDHPLAKAPWRKHTNAQLGIKWEAYKG